MVPLGGTNDMSDRQKSLLEHVMGRLGEADKLHRQFRAKWDGYHALYRSYKETKRAFNQVRHENDRDEVRREMKREFGEELFVPYCYSTVETVVPRVLSNDPRMLALPNNQAAEHSRLPVEKQFERDQNAMNYAMKLQDVARSGLIYGLGVGMTYWDERYRTTRERKKRLLLPGETVNRKSRKVFEGPGFEAVDIYDFFWDPSAKDMQTCDYVIFRAWRSMRYIKDQVSAGNWEELDLERVKGMAASTDRGSIWAERQAAAGISDADIGTTGLHEVLQYHDRDRVITVLDRALVVQEGENPFDHGDLPFQIFRPTPVPNEFVGIGEIEPITHLQYELNTMRGQRRDAATVALKRGYFIQRGAVEPEDWVMGPDAVVPTNFDPRESVFAMPIHDLPASSISEEEALKTDIVLTSGISESVAGTDTPSSSETATGRQLVQAQADLRIKQKSKNLVAELIRPAAAQTLDNYRQKVRKKRTLRVDDPTTPTGYSFIEIGPKDFAADLEIMPEGGSVEPDSKAQKVADAIQMTQALAPFIERLDETQVLKHLLRSFGVPQPESWIRDAEAQPVQEDQEEQGQEGEGPDVALMIGESMVQAGMSPEDAEQVLAAVAEQVDPNDVERFPPSVIQALAARGMDPEQATMIVEQAAQPQPA